MYLNIYIYIYVCTSTAKNKPCIPLAISFRPTSVDDVVGYLQVLAADWLWAPCGQHNQGGV